MTRADEPPSGAGYKYRSGWLQSPVAGPYQIGRARSKQRPPGSSLTRRRRRQSNHDEVADQLKLRKASQSDMGCCCSGHANAKETELPPPMFGKDIRVKIQRQGWFGLSADFDVLDCSCEGGEEKPAQWLLLDAVGGMSDSEYDYYLKYRAKGAKESSVLGCANMKMEHDYMWYEVTYAHQHYGRRPSTSTRRNRKWTDKQVTGRYIIARRGRLFNDQDQTLLCGRLQIAGSGTFQRHYHRETWRQKVRYTVKQGDKTVTKTKWVNKSSTQDHPETHLDHFFYKMHANGMDSTLQQTPTLNPTTDSTRCTRDPRRLTDRNLAPDLDPGTDFNVQYHKEASGSWRESDKLTFQASHQQSGVPLFKVVSDGYKKASLETYSHSDPVAALLAAFAISIKLEPKEFHGVCKNYCKSNFSLDSHTGQIGGFGKNACAWRVRRPRRPTAEASPS